MPAIEMRICKIWLSINGQIIVVKSLSKSLRRLIQDAAIEMRPRMTVGQY